jgi:biotin operon repressor
MHCVIIDCWVLKAKTQQTYDSGQLLALQLGVTSLKT